MQDELILFEQQCMRMLLGGDDPVLTLLRAQYKQVVEKKVTMTGVGFYVDYCFNSPVQRIDEVFHIKRDFEIGDISAYVPGLESGLGFILFIREGILSMLEAYTYDETFPEKLTGVVLSYGNNGERNLNKLAQLWKIKGDE